MTNHYDIVGQQKKQQLCNNTNIRVGLNDERIGKTRPLGQNHALIRSFAARLVFEAVPNHKSNAIREQVEYPDIVQAHHVLLDLGLTTLFVR